MSGTGFLRLKKLKGAGIVAAAARHNRRAIQAEVGASASIDPTRSGLNQTLQGPPTPEGVAMLASQRMREAGVGKLRKDAVMALEIVFSLPPDNALNDLQYFNDCASWAADSFGGTGNILSVDIHRDEAAPHCHVLLLPMVAGRMVGSELMGNRNKLLALQQDFHQVVAGRYGLKKAPTRLAGASKHNAAMAVLTRLRSATDAALRSNVWPEIRDAIERDPSPYVLALGIELDTPKKKRRTMTQIFTSKGRGGNVEKPIGFKTRSETRTLCPVGFAPTKPEQAALSAGAVNAVTRHRDHDLDPTTFDPKTGEFRSPAARSARLNSAAAAWVTAALTEIADADADASNDPAIHVMRARTKGKL